MEILKENVLDPICQTRNPDLFIGPDYQVLQSKVKNQILDVIYKWLEKMGYDYEQIVRSIHIIGSSVGWQYTDTSDIDVSIETSIEPEKIKQIWKLLPNGQLLKNHPINYYLTSDLKDVSESENAYDVLKDVWVKKQNKEDVEKSIPFNYIMEIAKFFISGVDDRIQEYEADKVELDYLKSLSKDDGISEEEQKLLIAQKETELKADLDAINIAHLMLKGFRNQAFRDGKPAELIIDIKSKGNSSINNTCYKMIMDKLKYEEKLKKYEQLRENLQKNGHL